MSIDRRSLEALIDQVGRFMVDAGIDERDDDVIRSAAEDVGRLIGAVAGHRPPNATARLVKRTYTKEEIDRLNKAAETYFRGMKDASFVLNKPMSGIFDPPILLYRFSVLLASLEIGFHTVLDFGAGSCWVSSLLNRMGCRTIALDVSETALRLGRQLFELDRRHRMDTDPQFLVFDGYTFPLQDESVDRIICFDAFHHVPNQEDILREMYRVLKRGGKAGFSEPGLEHSKAPMSVYEMETHGVLERDVDLDEFIGMVRAIGFDDVLIKPYPAPDRIAFSVPQYERFVNGDDDVFPLDVIREDMKGNTNVILQKGKPEWDTRRPRLLNALLRTGDSGPHRLTAGQPYTFRVSAKNLGDTIWLAKPNAVGGFVTVGARLHNAAKQPMEENYGRVHLSSDVHPGGTQAVDVALVAPVQKGVYHVELDMVCEMICWFAQRGSHPVWERIEVL